MNKLPVLLGIQARMQLSFLKPSTLKQELKQNGVKTVAKWLGILLLIIGAAAWLVWVEVKVMDALVSLQTGTDEMSLMVRVAMAVLRVKNLPDLLLLLITFSSMVMTLMFAIPQILGSMYFGKDTPNYAYLPASGQAVYVSRLFGVYLGETGITCLMIMPLVAIYMTRLGFDAGLLLRALLVILFSSMIPLAISCLICGLLASASGFLKHREFFTMIASFLLVGVVMAISFMSGEVSGSTMEDPESMRALLAELITGRTDLIQLLTGHFPPAEWAGRGLMGDWGQMGMFLALSVAAMAVPVLVLGRGYLAAAINVTETGLSGKKVDLKKANYGASSTTWALMKRELKEIVRVPSYAVNILFSTAVVPVMMVGLIAIAIVQSADLDIMDLVRLVTEELSEGIDTENFTIFALLMTAFFSWMLGLNSAASTSVTREGKYHGLLRALPVKGRTMVQSKVMTAFLLSAIGLIVTICALMAFLPLLVREFLKTLLWTLQLSYAFSCIGVLVDILHPKLHWETETAAVKRNFNVMIEWLLSLVILGLGGWGIFELLDHGMGLHTLSICVTAVLLVVDLICHVALMTWGVKRYEAIDG